MEHINTITITLAEYNRLKNGGRNLSFSQVKFTCPLCGFENTHHQMDSPRHGETILEVCDSDGGGCNEYIVLEKQITCGIKVVVKKIEP